MIAFTVGSVSVVTIPAPARDLLTHLEVAVSHWRRSLLAFPAVFTFEWESRVCGSAVAVMVMSPVPSNAVPLMFRAVASLVAVAAFPVISVTVKLLSADKSCVVPLTVIVLPTGTPPKPVSV